MLYEVKDVRQICGEEKRRWFVDEAFDLLIWETGDKRITGFQLCYNKEGIRHVLSWQEETGYMHNLLDEGEDRPGKYKMSPILVMNGQFSGDRVAEMFLNSSIFLEKHISSFIYGKIRQYPD